MKKGNLYFLIFIYSLCMNSISANSIYYEHKVSQFELLSKENDKNIIMLGDSITDRGLWNELANRNDIINRGISGDTTSGVLNRLDSLSGELSQAFIMIGINDLLQGKSVEVIFENYRKIISILKEKNIIPIIQSTLYVGENAPKLYNDKVKKLNNLLQNYTKKNKLTYINLNLNLSPKGFLSKNYSLDGLHLNGKGYFIWIKSIQEYFMLRDKENK